MKTHKASVSWFLARTQRKKKKKGILVQNYPKSLEPRCLKVPTVVLGLGISFDFRQIWNIWKRFYPQMAEQAPQGVATAQDRAQAAFGHSGTCTTLNGAWSGKTPPDRAVIPWEFCQIFHGTTTMANPSRSCDTAGEMHSLVWLLLQERVGMPGWSGRVAKLDKKLQENIKICTKIQNSFFETSVNRLQGRTMSLWNNICSSFAENSLVSLFYQASVPSHLSLLCL